MPRVPQEFIDCSIYLYPTVDAANAGEQIGGSGFLLGFATKLAPDGSNLHLYAVTNKHVAQVARVVRLNTRNGDFDVLPTADSSWFCHPDGDDLAVCPIRPSRMHRFAYVEFERLITRHYVYDLRSVVPGMEVFLVGRFIGREGRQRNTPTVRVGNVAQLPDEPVCLENEPRDMFLVDMRTIKGSSGSPVAVYCKYAEVPSMKWREEWYLLGVNWGYLVENEPVCVQKGSETKETSLFVQGHSGIACVVPAWKLTELLQIEALQKMRMQADLLEKAHPVNGSAAPS